MGTLGLTADRVRSYVSGTQTRSEHVWLPVRAFMSLINQWIKNKVIFLSEAALKFQILTSRSSILEMLLLPPCGGIDLLE